MRIFGNTVTTTLPKPDYAQEDPGRGSYIHNKPDLDAAITQAKAEVLVEVNKRATTASYTGSFPASGWTGEEAPFSQSISVPGLLQTDNPFVDIDLSGEGDAAAIAEAWVLVGRVTVPAADTLTAYCLEEKPEVDIPVLLKVVR